MIEGEWELTGDGITGWARSVESDSPLWVELVADGVPCGIACADLPARNGCGFWMPIATDLLEDNPALEVRAANTSEKLARKEMLIGKSKPAASLEGEIFLDSGLTISGWVMDASNSAATLQVNAFVDGKPAGTVTAYARSYRPIQSDWHGFQLTLPFEFADGKMHTVELRDEQGRSLPGSPLKMLVHPRDTFEWLRNCKNPDASFLTALGDMVFLANKRVPGVSTMLHYAKWKEYFPVTVPQKQYKANIYIPGGKAVILKNQQKGDFRYKDKSGDYVLLPGGMKSLHPLALANMVHIMKTRDADLVYADAETESGEPLFKPAWDREAFFAQDYLGPMLVNPRVLREAEISPEDSDSVVRLKVVLAARETGILHLPMSLAVHSLELSGAERNAIINDWLAHHYPGSAVADGRVRYGMAEKPKISILIPSRDHGAMLKRCLDSLKMTAWPDLEIIIIDNGTVEDDALAVLNNASQEANVCVLRRPGVFNYASLNNDAARIASGKYICFLNNDTEITEPDWLSEMAALLGMAGAEAGCVGAKLLWPNGLVQHAGVIAGVHQLAAAVGNQWLADEAGYMNRNLFAQRYSVVTAACLLTPRELFLDNKGFDGFRFPVAFNDVDYCLRLAEAGKKNYWTPHARLIHHESASRGKDLLESAKARSRREMRLFRTRWGHFEDPFYNPNLPLSAVTDPFVGLAFPPRAREAR